MLGRRLSLQNGFGPFPRYSLTNTHSNERMTVDLHTLLFSFTCAEEAAIRQTSPLMCITKYSMGNICSKGSVSCVFQDCQLQRILPNTPQLIIIIVIMRGKKKKDLKPWKFEKRKIMRAL